ncbi:MAG: hypothetical protein SGBAC_002437 [Bacillariaceae sp.]
MCSQSDSTGCPRWVDDANTVPLLGDDSKTTCSLSGKGSAVGAFGGKCSNSNDVLMFQEGSPGLTLYWILKDGEDSDQESTPYTNMPYFGASTGCSASVERINYDYKCGSDGNDVQKKKEDTWASTIPDGTDGSCDVCAGSNPPLTPTPPTPTPPLNPTTLTAPVQRRH